MNETLLRQLLADVKTPSYIFNQDEFLNRANLVRKAFGEKTGLCFSIKANPFLLGCLPDTFNKIEVCSPGELTICIKTGIDSSKIIFSGVNKTAADVERAMEYGAGTFTAESFLHVSLINNSAINRGITVPVLVRVTGGSQFGMDENDVISLINNRHKYKGVEFVGLHYFTGTQKRKPAAIEKELDYISHFAERLKAETGFETKRIEYGTGLAVDYFKDNADELEQERLEAISAKVRQISNRYELTVEMGRFFAASCGYYLTRVMDVKTNCGVNYAICDGGLNQLKYDGQIQGMQIPKIIHIKNNEAAESKLQKWTLCGSLCTTADILARDAQFDSLEIGDTLVFCRTGAYSAMEGMAVFLSREMPVISLYSKAQGLKILRNLIYTDIFNTP
ncbi:MULTISPECIES: diaminopimelate decarboxylase [unclassified Ruminococcus]|uniref:diaminopimelate decarboxylase family protein n=1 Tax=unclassified Ruminococcus TaxID=2608920 RepID=UPI00210B7BD5|nr:MULTISPECIES: diaminopimelate decarboxylase [unclassified Ruminococcus]MCQ4022540.1 diaminopimelate decarboxylase [Ruminococcus sp. zg-924]MCQ4114780.1 diaminopimelate decarboxylase [Ruminococcus sp. zg-921]